MDTKLKWLKVKNKILLLVFILVFVIKELNAQQATWIWYPGDYEIWLANKMENRRTERGTFLPVFWKVDSHYPLIDFHKDFTLPEPEEVFIYAEGLYNVKLDGKPFEGAPALIRVPAGKHKINVKVFNQQYVPAIYVKGTRIFSDASWLVTFEDKEWIDETGKTSDVSATKWMNAGSGNFDSPTLLPSQFKLSVSPRSAVSVQKTVDNTLMDFGKETFGFIKFHGIRGQGKLNIYYGESREEALTKESAETLDRLQLNLQTKTDSTIPLSKAFRFINIESDPSINFDSVSMIYEFAAVKDKGNFTCSDELINKIYDVAKYTLHLNTREFFIDGIKRDRWIWSGDAYQSYLMNYYLFFDSSTVQRTIYALRGKDPVTSHINTIMDYTSYWFMGVYDYYLYTGDADFIKQIYPRMQSMMDYVLGRRNANGFLEGLPGDWIFIDWAAGLSKQGEVSFEQLLLARSLETMAICAGLSNDPDGQKKYQKLADDLKVNIFSVYWNPSKHALVHSRVKGGLTENVTRYSNMFAIFFDYFDGPQKEEVKKYVLLNDSIQKITTPYMRFYELEALCAMGEQPYVLKEMKSYWGGMLNLGATSFWEEYDPTKKGAEHYAMYGRKFGKSLCHAWGASPIYLLGKYYLGVKPTSPGYATYSIEPNLGGLKWMQGAVPTPAGNIEVSCSEKEMKIKGVSGTGTLRFRSKSKPVCQQGMIEKMGTDEYSLRIEKDKTYTINYTSKN